MSLCVSVPSNFKQKSRHARNCEILCVGFLSQSSDFSKELRRLLPTSFSERHKPQQEPDAGLLLLLWQQSQVTSLSKALGLLRAPASRSVKFTYSHPQFLSLFL